MLTLYEHPLSPYAQKVKIALREKGEPFEAKMPGGIGAGGASGEFPEANPRAEVPVLIDGETRIFDSTIILEYIEDKWPAPALLPETPAGRARIRMIEDVCDTHYEAINWGLGEIGWFRRAEGELGETLRERAAEQTERLQAWLARQLGTRDWFNGASFGWGDLAVAPFVNTSAGFGNAPDEGSALGRWFARAKARESVALTLKEAAASIAGMEVVANILEQGLFKREYRDHRLEWMIKSGGIEVVLKGLEKNNIRFTADFE